MEKKKKNPIQSFLSGTFGKKKGLKVKKLIDTGEVEQLLADPETAIAGRTFQIVVTPGIKTTHG